MKWLFKRFTFVVIPDANQSVQRYSLSVLMLVMVPAIIILLTICSALFIYLFSNHSHNVKQLKAQLTASQAGYDEVLQEKQDQIAILEADLSVLSDQAKQIEGKISEITDLEHQLKEIAGIEEKEVSISSNSLTEEGGRGGLELPVTTDSDGSLAIETMRDFSYLSSQLDEMKPSLESTIQALVKYQHILNITPTIWPADSRKITSTFGVRKDPITNRSALHNGLDLGGSRGDAVYATADGVVSLSERDYPHGHNIIIDHGRGIQTRYLHLNTRLVQVGDKIVKGDIIGELGNTGRSTGPHLHYEVIVGGKHVDPMPYIKEDRKDK